MDSYASFPFYIIESYDSVPTLCILIETLLEVSRNLSKVSIAHNLNASHRSKLSRYKETMSTVVLCYLVPTPHVPFFPGLHDINLA